MGLTLRELRESVAIAAHIVEATPGLGLRLRPTLRGRLVVLHMFQTLMQDWGRK